MVKQTVGYVELEWTCPNCGNRNPGTAIKCATCGNPQPEEVQFEAGASGELLTDQAKIARAKAGPDVACPFCGTRNLATAERCKQCGGDLKEAKAREAGRTVGAYRPGVAAPIKCANCGTENVATATKCANCGAPLGKPVEPAAKPAQPAAPMPRWLIPAIVAVVAIALIACVAFFAARSAQRTTRVVEVQGVEWQRTILIQALAPVTRSAWQDELPGNADVVGCDERVRRTSPEPAPGAVEVCGTPYVQDTGTGVGEVVQDCEYQIFEPYCQYRTLAWVAAPAVVAEGSDVNPFWPQTRLGNDQREAGRQETYSVLLGGDGESYRLPIDDVQQFQDFTPGSRWTVVVNGFGDIVDIEPSQ
jgi:hypothetical protein